MVDALPEVEWIVAANIVPGLREAKNGAELEIVRETGRVADAQMVAMLDVAAPGVTEQDVVGAGIAAGGMPYVAHTASEPAEYRLSPEPLPTWFGRRLAEGDLWRVDPIGAYQGYMFDFARSTVVGGPSDAQEALLEPAIAVVESVIAVIEPGWPIAPREPTLARARSPGTRPARLRPQGTTTATSGTRPDPVGGSGCAIASPAHSRRALCSPSRWCSPTPSLVRRCSSRT